MSEFDVLVQITYSAFDSASEHTVRPTTFSVHVGRGNFPVGSSLQEQRDYILNATNGRFCEILHVYTFL